MRKLIYLKRGRIINVFLQSNYEFQAQVWTKVVYKIRQYDFDLFSCKGWCIALS